MELTEDQAIAVSAIIEFGYTHEGDSLIKYKAGKPRERYDIVEGGFLRFTREDGEWKPLALGVNAAGEGISGLDQTRPEHAGFFEWVYPADFLLAIYAHAVQERE